MEGVLIPIFICVVLPVSIVGIVFGTHINADNKRAKILMKAIDANNNIDADKLVEALQPNRKSEREILNRRLLRGCIYSFVGIALIIASIVGRTSGLEYSADPVSVPFIFGIVILAVGVSFLITYFVTRKELTHDRD